MKKMSREFDIEVSSLIVKKPQNIGGYLVYSADPATGILYIINNFLSGHVRLRGKGKGAYPFNYLEMIDSLFGKADNCLEVCSGGMEGNINLTTCDIHIGEKDNSPDIVCDAQVLPNIPDEKFDRWRADPPYNPKRAKGFYQSEMPSLIKLLKAGARVVQKDSLLFLLCSQNYQICPKELKRIGLITISIVPNNEIRACNIYIKL